MFNAVKLIFNIFCFLSLLLLLSTLKYFKKNSNKVEIKRSVDWGWKERPLIPLSLNNSKSLLFSE